MPRRARPTERRRAPDRKFGNTTLQQFNNNVMRNGKRATAEALVYGALTIAETSTRKPGIDVFDTALKNAMPLIEVKPRRVGGATYQVPVEIAPVGATRPPCPGSTRRPASVPARRWPGRPRAGTGTP